MPTEILMPALSPTMEEGKLAKWLVKEGQAVKPGDVIAEIETDKATMEVEAVDEGKVGQLLVEAGTEGVKVNTPIATLLAEGESAGAAPKPKAATPQAATPRAEAHKAVAAASASSAPSTTKPATAAAKSSATAGAASASASTSSHDRIFASPLARRLAKTAGIEIGALAGSGPHGRVVKRDVESALANG